MRALPLAIRWQDRAKQTMMLATLGSSMAVIIYYTAANGIW